MRLLTHNIMTCNVGECKTSGNNYPLRIQAEEMAKVDREFSMAFMVRMLGRLDWSGVVAAATDLSFEGIPSEIPDSASEDEAFLQMLHTLLLEMEVVTGSLTCPNCSRAFPIKETIVNMVLREDEV